MTKKNAIIKRCFLAALLSLCFFWTTGPVCAENRDIEFDYDIFLTGDTLAIWLDFTPILNQPKMEDLLAGLDLSILIDFKVEKPRRLAFSKTLATARAAVVISHPLTEDIYRLRLVNFGVFNYEFENQLELSDFLADSLVLKIVPQSHLAEDSDLRLNLKIVSKSHSSNILDEFPASSNKSGEAEQGGEEEFFESLLSLFLDIIGFGKTSYHVISPPFMIGDLVSL